MEGGERRMYYSNMQRKQPQSVSQTSHTVIVNYWLKRYKYPERTLHHVVQQQKKTLAD